MYSNFTLILFYSFLFHLPSYIFPLTSYIVQSYLFHILYLTPHPSFLIHLISFFLLSHSEDLASEDKADDSDDNDDCHNDIGYGFVLILFFIFAF